MTDKRCRFAMANEKAVSHLIFRNLEQRKPFSLVRLGDGEGVLLSINSQSPEYDFAYLSEHLGPDNGDRSGVRTLKHSLINAISHSDVVGVRDDIVDVRFDNNYFGLPPDEFLAKFRRSFRLREVEKKLGYRGARRIALLHNSLGSLTFGNEQQFCSAWIHFDLHASGSLFRLLNGEDRIGLISSRKQLPRLLQSVFGTSVKFVEIPDKYRNLPEEAKVSNYVNGLESVLSKTLVEFPGMLFLIGGGLYGKAYCQIIKSQGGMAIDVGSLIDAWLGIASRPVVYKSRFPDHWVPNRVPEPFLLNHANIRRILGKD